MGAGVQAFGATYTLGQIAKTSTTFAVAGGGTGARAAGTIILRADVGNASVNPLLWGFNSAQIPIAPGEAIAIDVPPGYWVDLTHLFFSGNGNTGQVVYITAIVLPFP